MSISPKIKDAFLRLRGDVQQLEPKEGSPQRKRAIRNRRLLALIEASVWLTGATVFIVLTVASSIQSINKSGRLEILNFVFFAFSIGFLTIPVFSALVQKVPPFSAMFFTMVDGISTIGKDQGQKELRDNRQIALELVELSPRELMLYFSLESKDIAEMIFKRGGMYLVAGFFIAVASLLAFFVIFAFRNTQGQGFDYLAHLLPSASFLFFSELLAFFFLRLYRTAMDEFRALEGIKRSRQETFIAMKMFAENLNEVSTIDVLKSMSIYSDYKSLNDKETTEIIQLRKGQTDELSIFMKLLNFFERESAKSRRS